MLPILLYSLFAVVRGAPSQANVDLVPRAAPIPGATVVPLFWDVQAFPGGPTLTLNGTIQEMSKQLLEINPNYYKDFNQTTTARGLDHDLEKRTNWNGCQLECSRPKWGEPIIRGYDEGLQYLYNHGGVPHMGPGPGACSRVSCSYDTGIWMCNDTPNDKYLISFGSVADGAKYIWMTCGDDKDYDMVGGQVFHPTGWNVILSRQDC